ncbi:hypothetical protein Pmani_035128 [Petrolisthes manimaculis]|uniref:Uncharacterized protein n=1 Tax=Petrolisthes manimaculis TaxID=1843537 RepID=A0AAE1NL87_9EUCA|nr:hypothetical protein Pmani_035128 [Petrolisthes manimaculis]
MVVDENDDSDSDWGEEEWPVGRPLPLPEWGCERPEVRFVSLAHYHKFISSATEHLKADLASQPYDAVSNFIWFGREYQKNRGEYPNLREFYRDYDPPMVPGHYTCVGLSAHLASRLADLEKDYPGLKDAMYQVSCEEELNQEEMEMHSELREPITSVCLIEHVMLCIRMCVNDRHGVILFDPGYHLGQPVTVMEDGAFPHTGVVKGCTANDNVKKFSTFNFFPNNNAFVMWNVREIRSGVVHKEYYSLLHVTRPFLSGLDVSERRSILFKLKSLICRDGSDHLPCGFYMFLRNLTDTNVTFFYESNGVKNYYKKKLSYFLDERPDQRGTNWRYMDEEIETALQKIAVGTGINLKELRYMLISVAELAQDEKLLLEINEFEDDMKETFEN